jgi:toxin-antitoxin system PIN domain toxin
MTELLDANVLIALVVADHVHHDAAETWLAGFAGRIATCPITEGSLVRLLIRQGQDGPTAHAVLTALAEHPRYEFWADSISYREVPLGGVIGHRQVTDAYLVHLARAHQTRLVTFDRGLAGLHGDLVRVIPTG